MRIVTLLATFAFFSVGCEAPASQMTEAPSAAQPEVVSVQPAVKNAQVSQAHALLVNNPGVIVLDVRTAAEFNEGHIDGALNIDFKAPDFELKISQLDRDVPYLIHCRSGRRSTLALATFKSLGFTDITHLDGGIKAWNSAGLAVTDPCLREC